MKSLQLAAMRTRGTSSLYSRLLGSLLFGVFFCSSALAAEGENVRLNFSGGNQTWLIITAVLGLLGIVSAAFFASSVLKEGEGSDAMQEVSKAIRDGSNAYLVRQITMMAPFIVILACGLPFLYREMPNFYLVGVTFFFGVASSYLSGSAGMTIAVQGNVRVAAAALTSNKKALEIAFKSGSVAGLLTVGVALLFSSIILLAFPAIATVLLIAYGFGGSLAALFMRVGGGIYTKAADVGADLVGKVEAGIPEDSPRNPATIADNVGDNVGDCAGMAADVFESYEVMLVATIVLGAATSAVLDASTWPKLIVFALATCGLGIVASLIAINLVKGSDDLDSDPLKPILNGFHYSALIATVFTVLLAVSMVKDVKVQELVTRQSVQVNRIKAIQLARVKLAELKGKKLYEITERDVLADSAVKAIGLTDADTQMITQAFSVSSEALSNFKGLEGYVELSEDDIAAGKLKALQYAFKVSTTTQGSQTKPYITIAEQFSPKNTEDKLIVTKVSMKADLPAQNGQPGRKVDNSQWMGPISSKQLDVFIRQQIDAMKAQKYQGEIKTIGEKIPVKLFYSARADKFALVAGPGVDKPDELQSFEIPSFFRMSVAEREAFDKTQGQAPVPMSGGPEAVQIETASIVVTNNAPWWLFAISVVFGIVMGIIIEQLTNYYVSATKRPTREVAGVATAGPAPMLIQGFAYGLESSVFMVLAIVVTLLVPLVLFKAITGSIILGFYGIALVGIGLLTSTAYILAMDTFGPISDNSQGVFEMSGEGHNEYGSKSLQRLDAAGNTTKALTKGFAIATAVIASVALFQSFIESAHLEGIGLRLDVPEIFLGLLIGAAAPYLFSAFAINAVGRSAFELIQEVRRQFKADPGILAGTSKPDYAKCVAMVTAAAQRELVSPGILAIVLPIAVGFGFSIGKAPTEIGGNMFNLAGAQALGGFLAGAIASGQLMAVLLANSGGMWDNAKKIIEDGLHGGKGTEAHKASVVCDTVGDPFKDTAGPALNPLIKVMNLVALLIVGIIIQPMSLVMSISITAVCVALLIYAFMRGKKGSLAESMQSLDK